VVDPVNHYTKSNAKIIRQYEVCRGWWLHGQWTVDTICHSSLL